MTNNETKKKILVVEDDEDSRQALCTIIEGLGYSFISFASGPDALNGIKNQQLDLALVDIMMPQMSGYEFLVELRKLAEFKDLPVIMVTAKDDDSEILEGYQYGADYYITKPYTSKQLQYGIKLYID